MAGLSNAVRAYRSARVREFLRENGYDALIVSSTDWFEWLSNSEIHENVGERPIVLVVTASGNSFALVSELSRHAIACGAELGSLWIDTVHKYQECPHLESRTLREWPDAAAAVLNSAGLARAKVAVDSLSKPLPRVAALLPGLQLVEPGEALRRLRWVKHAEEIATMRRAAALSVWAIGLYHQELRPGRVLKEVDYSVAAKMSAEAARTMPGENYVISSLFTLSGINSTSPKGDGAASGKVLENNTIAITVLGTRLNGVSAEVTRPWLVGSPPAEVVSLLNATRAAQQASIDASVAGRPVCGIHTSALEAYARAGVERFFTLRAAHGIGVVMHDFPLTPQFDERPLLAGETYAIEPSLCVPGIGGFRFSDSVAVGAGKPELITPQDGEKIQRISA